MLAKPCSKKKQTILFSSTQASWYTSCICFRNKTFKTEFSSTGKGKKVGQTFTTDNKSLFSSIETFLWIPGDLALSGIPWMAIRFGLDYWWIMLRLYFSENYFLGKDGVIFSWNPKGFCFMEVWDYKGGKLPKASQ